jgi:hypothetical protein
MFVSYYVCRMPNIDNSPTIQYSSTPTIHHILKQFSSSFIEIGIMNHDCYHLDFGKHLIVFSQAMTKTSSINCVAERGLEYAWSCMH